MTTPGVITAIPQSALPQPIAAASAHPKLGANFVASGAGVRTGVVIDKISYTDGAPTIAKLAGVKMQDIEGQPLETFLLPRSPNLSVSPSPNCPCPRR